MRIEDDRKLDYRDVLIRPKRSTLGSRKDVDLFRKFNFRHYQGSEPGDHYHGIPIMASNMDGVGTFEMADSLAKIGLFTSLVKNYDADQLVDFFAKDDDNRLQNVAYSMGITES
ncbi:MAG: GMP reductase, partial [Gammaproteobacteria bacterium]